MASMHVARQNIRLPFAELCEQVRAGSPAARSSSRASNFQTAVRDASGGVNRPHRGGQFAPLPPDRPYFPLFFVRISVDFRLRDAREAPMLDAFS